MIDFDNGPILLAVVIVLVYAAPFIYSLFIDNYDKQNKS